VAAYDILGNLSPQATTTASTAACPLPVAPSGIVLLSATKTSVTLSWQPSAYASGYYLYRSGVQLASTTQTNATWSGLNCDSSYRFSVQAYSLSGTSAPVDFYASTAACAPPPADTTPPSPPGQLVPGGATQTSIPVSWS